MRLAESAPGWTGFSDFPRWWIEELKTLVPAGGWTSRQPVTVFRAADDSLTISLPKSSGASEKTYPPDEHARAIKALKRRATGRRPARLVLDEAHCLVRTTRIPAAAQNRAGDILLLELERITPFRRGEVCFGWRVVDADPAGTTVVVEQAIVKRDVLAPTIGDLFAAGFQHIGVACRRRDGTEIGIRLPPELARNDSTGLRIARTINRLAAAALVVAACIATWILFDRQADAIERLDETIAAAQAQAVDVRTKYDAGLTSARGILDLRHKKSTSPAVTTLIEELTRILPDDAWLTELRSNGEDVEIAGYAQSAAGLTVLLDRSDLFGDVKFVSPVVRSPQDNVERFNIALRTTGPPEPLAEAATP